MAHFRIDVERFAAFSVTFQRFQVARGSPNMRLQLLMTVFLLSVERKNHLASCRKNYHENCSPEMNIRGANRRATARNPFYENRLQQVMAFLAEADGGIVDQFSCKRFDAPPIYFEAGSPSKLLLLVGKA